MLPTLERVPTESQGDLVTNTFGSSESGVARKLVVQHANKTREVNQLQKSLFDSVL